MDIHRQKDTERDGIGGIVIVFVLPNDTHSDTPRAIIIVITLHSIYTQDSANKTT